MSKLKVLHKVHHIFTTKLTSEERGYKRCSASYLAMPDTLVMMGRAYLVLLVTAHKEVRYRSDFIPVVCLSWVKLYFLYKFFSNYLALAQALRIFWFITNRPTIQSILSQKFWQFFITSRYHLMLRGKCKIKEMKKWNMLHLGGGGSGKKSFISCFSSYTP